MIYLENTTSAQTLWIPRPEYGDGLHRGEITVVITADTTTVDTTNVSSVIIDATNYAQEQYENGFNDGFEDGYASGSTEN